MKFYKVAVVNPGPGANLVGTRYSIQRYGNGIVEETVPEDCEIDVYYSAQKWPDLLHSLDCTIWSKRVVQAFQDAGLQGVEFHLLRLRSVEDKRLLKRPYPDYHWANATSGVPAIPYQEDKITPCERYPETGFFNLERGGGLRRWKFDFSQWNGADLFYIATAHTLYRYCTERFKALVESHEFTNFRFSGAQNEEGDDFFV